jgi:DNA-binding CsgD family transcriptional regulator/N-acetylneuraminic acid mutarotase
VANEPGDELSERELEITSLVTEGLTNREIAARLFLSHNTVKVHLRNIFTKTGVASRTELSMLAVQEGWVTLQGIPEQLAVPSPDAQEAFAPLRAERATASDERVPPIPAALPAWPWQRWSVLTFGLILVLFVFALPRRRVSTPTTTGPGIVFGAVDPAASIPQPSAGAGWQELAPLPVRRAGMGAVGVQGRIYLIGGMTDGGASDRVDIYDAESDTWRPGGPRPVSLANVSAVALGQEILVPGGCTDDAYWTPSNVAHLYDPADDTWSEAAPLPTPLCAYALAAYEDRAYLFGGWDGQSYQALAYRYDPKSDAWEALRAPEHAGGFGAAAALENRILYVGGFVNERELATCEAYAPAEDRWESCGSMLQPRGGLSLVAIGGRAYAIGGGWHTPLGFNERYTPGQDEWSVVESPIVGEWRNLGAVPSETSIYAFGGYGEAGFLNRTHVVEIMPWRVFIPGTFRTP